LPFDLVVTTSVRLFGSAASWLPLLLFFPLAGLGAGRLVRQGHVGKAAAGLLYAVNPMVFERTWAGHFGFLLGYALLPWVADALIRMSDQRGLGRLEPALWLAAAVGFSVHFLWIGGVLLAVAVVSRTYRSLGWTGGVVGCVLLSSAYLLAPFIAHGTSGARSVSSVAPYATRGDHSLGLFVNVLGLYGFWRPEPTLPKQIIGVWPLLLIAILAVAALGLWSSRNDRHQGPRLRLLVAAGVIGYFLALGEQGPTGSVFRLLLRLPGFDVMREPQKFVALVALAYAAAFGVGVQRLADWTKAERSTAPYGALLAIVALALPPTYTPTLFAGLGSQIRATDYPKSWTDADRLMGGGDGKVLMLPWHQYLAFPFTRGRVIANPASVAFRRDVISSDDPELFGGATRAPSDRSQFIRSLLDSGDNERVFSRAVAPLGVQYVLVAHTVDWTRFGWLDTEPGLTKVLDSDDLTVYRNSEYRSGGFRTPSLGTVASNSSPASINAAGLTRDAISPSGIQHRGRTDYQVSRGAPGTLILPEPFDRGWALGTHRATKGPGGITALTTSGDAGTAHFRPWSVVILVYLACAAIFLTLIATVGSSHWLGSLKQDRRQPDNE
jgi:hypothetical protein